MKIRHKIFFIGMISIGVALFVLYAPDNAFSKLETNVNPDITADQVKAFVVEDFEDASKAGPIDGSKGGWKVTTDPKQVTDKNKMDRNPIAILEHKIIPGRPNDMKPDKWSHYKVITAENGKDGLEKASQEKPDLILLDTNMPVMNGYEMLERIRKDSVLKNTPVIMVTALCDAKDVNKASSFGISDYVTKPVDFAKLTEKISKILNKKS